MKRFLTGRTGWPLSWVWLVLVVAVPHAALAVRNITIGDPIPGFVLPRADGVSGIFSSEDLVGQPTVMTFWRPNHEFSIAALRDLEVIANEVGVSQFKLLAVDTRRSAAEDIQAFLSEETISFPILLDPQRRLYERVGLIVSPTTLLFDADGMLRFVVAGRPRLFRQVVKARLRFLLGQIDEQTMDQRIKPATHSIEPDVATAWRLYNLGRKLQAEMKNDEAISVFQKAVSYHPALAEAHCALGFLALEAGQLPVAARSFRSALAAQAKSPAAQLGLAAVLARSQEVDHAEQILLPLLEEKTKSISVRVRYELGRICQNRGEFEKAAMYYQDALESIFSEPVPATVSAPSDN